jgi:carbonic anhydrase
MTDRRTFLTIPVVAVASAVVARAGASAPASAATPPPTSTPTPTLQQSPVNVVRSAVQLQAGLPQLQVHYSRSVPVGIHFVSKDDPSTGGCSVHGSEETEEVDIPAGAGYVLLSGTRYDLLQFHFHTPSEHTFDGRHAPLEMHLVHQDAAGRKLVIGIPLVEGKAGEVDRILSRLPDECGQPIEVDDFNLFALLPANTSTLRYNGSLTTSPYSEGVQWFLTVPKTVSARSIAGFQSLFPDGDSRPAQALNGRHLLADVHWSGHW